MRKAHLFSGDGPPSCVQHAVAGLIQLIRLTRQGRFQRTATIRLGNCCSSQSAKLKTQQQRGSRVRVRLGTWSGAGSEPVRLGMHSKVTMAAPITRSAKPSTDAHLHVQEPFQQWLHCGISEHAFRPAKALTGSGSAACDQCEVPECRRRYHLLYWAVLQPPGHTEGLNMASTNFSHWLSCRPNCQYRPCSASTVRHYSGRLHVK